MVQDFHFKILHHPINKHANADALSRNPIFISVEEDNFKVEITDHVVSSSKIVAIASMKFMFGTSSGHGVPRIFTLLKHQRSFHWKH